MAGVAATVVTDLAAPDSDIRTGVAVRASPGKDIPVCRLHDDENVTRALVGHFVANFQHVNILPICVLPGTGNYNEDLFTYYFLPQKWWV